MSQPHKPSDPADSSIATDVSSWPKITLITPSFNQASYLEATLASVAGQRYPNLEHIVIDGGSTDHSVAIIRNYESHLAWWVSEPDRGQTHAINKGLEAATGEVVGWLNSDDLLPHGALHRIGRAMRNRRVNAVCGWCLHVDDQGRIVDRQVYPQPTPQVLLSRSLLPQPTVYWRKSLHQTVGFLDESLAVCMDLDFWIRLAQAGIAPRLIHDWQAIFRVQANQKTQTLQDKWDREKDVLFLRTLGRTPCRHDVPKTWRLMLKLYHWRQKCGWPAIPPLDPNWFDTPRSSESRGRPCAP